MSDLYKDCPPAMMTEEARARAGFAYERYRRVLFLGEAHTDQPSWDKLPELMQASLTVVYINGRVDGWRERANGDRAGELQSVLPESAEVATQLLLQVPEITPDHAISAAAVAVAVMGEHLRALLDRNAVLSAKTSRLEEGGTAGTATRSSRNGRQPKRRPRSKLPITRQGQR